MDTGTQTDRIITTPLEVLAVSCITYAMIDKIRETLDRAEQDLATLLFRNCIPESVLGQSACEGEIDREKPLQNTAHQDKLLSESFLLTEDKAVDNTQDHEEDSRSLDFSEPEVPLMSKSPINVSLCPNDRHSPKKRKNSSTSKRKKKQARSLKLSTSDSLDKEETKVKTEETAVMADDGLGVYKCQNCMADFTTPARLTRHISMVHASRAVAEQGVTHGPSSVQSHQCIVCNQTFANSTVLRDHQLKHHRTPINKGTGEICQICGKWLVDITSHREHKKKHNVSKNFRCHVCFKGFSRNDNLMQHLKVVHDVTHEEKDNRVA